MARCPIKRLSEYGLTRTIFTKDELDAWTEEFRQEIGEAVAAAKRSPFPAVETIFDGTD